MDGGKRDWSWERGRREKGEKGEKMGGRREGEKESEGEGERRKGRGIGKRKRERLERGLRTRLYLSSAWWSWLKYLSLHV